MLTGFRTALPGRQVYSRQVFSTKFGALIRNNFYAYTASSPNYFIWPLQLSHAFYKPPLFSYYLRFLYDDDLMH